MNSRTISNAFCLSSGSSLQLVWLKGPGWVLKGIFQQACFRVVVERRNNFIVGSVSTGIFFWHENDIPPV